MGVKVVLERPRHCRFNRSVDYVYDHLPTFLRMLAKADMADVRGLNVVSILDGYYYNNILGVMNGEIIGSCFVLSLFSSPNSFSASKELGAISILHSYHALF